MTTLREAAQQAMEALEWHLERGAYGADIEGVTGNLRAALAQQAEPVEPVAHRVVAGALFDFMGWLTSRRERLVLSSTNDAAPAADAIKDFAEMRGLSLDDAKVQDWNTAPPQQAEPVQEPVAWMYPDDYAGILKHQSRAEVFQKAWCNPAVCVPLYTTPPQRKPLTDEEIKECLPPDAVRLPPGWAQFARAVERKVRGEEK